MQQVHDTQKTPSIWMRPIRRLRRLLLDYNFEFAEFQVGLAALLWGSWLILPFWNTFESSNSFHVLRDSGIEESWWGLGIALVGALQLIGLIWEHRSIRRFASFALVLVWLFISLMFILSNPAATATVIYPLFALSSAWAHWRIGLV